MLQAASDLPRTGGLHLAALPKRFPEAPGCPECGFAGYRGRTLIAEKPEVSLEIARAVRDNA